MPQRPLTRRAAARRPGRCPPLRRAVPCGVREGELCRELQRNYVRGDLALTRDLGYRFPDFHGAELAPAPRALAELCRARLEERYPIDSLHRGEAERRLADELRLVERHGLSGFFLVYHDLFDLARQVAADVRRGSRRAQGGPLTRRRRGSARSFLLCFLVRPSPLR